MTNEAEVQQVPSSWPTVISALIESKDLPVSAAQWAMEEIMTGAASPAQISAFLVGLRAKGETVDELTGMVNAMLAQANAITIPGETLDIVGTGGDGLETVNISTMSSLVAVGAGAKVVKHGNRGASTKSGSADVIEALGVRLDQPIAKVVEVFNATGITFCFAQVFHPSMRFAAVPRREIGVPTAFNVLGPLANPAGVAAQALGVANESMAPKMAGVLAQRGIRALVIRGGDGRDKFTTSTTSQVWEVRNGHVTSTVIDPRDLGIELASVDALRGSDAESNAAIVRRTLAGESGPVRDAVVLNTAAGLVAADPDHNGPLLDRLAAGMVRAVESIDSGAAENVLQNWIAASAD
ncbi:anthranilate phosphoribosyltransferase [Pseudarthrobacter sp. J1763]|uniref:anthranilate phosphoribosyltransferase n=1 Tax=Pseudarthrobacter sp. J1763 TaxID=3420445 RepID=UPI003D2DDB74